MNLKQLLSTSEFITIKDEFIRIESIDYVTTKEAQKSKENKAPVYILSIVLKSGVQIAIPFEKKSNRLNNKNKLKKILKDGKITE